MDKTIKIFLHIPKTGGATFKHFIFDSHKPDSYYFFVNDKNQSLNTSIEQFDKIPISDKDKYKWFLGHYGFGIHEHIRNKKADYFTMIRDPIERVLSNYYYVVSYDDHKWYRHGFNKNQSLNFLYKTRFHMALFNYQTRFLACTNGKVISFEEKQTLDESDLKNAIRNLDKHFKLVGITERLDDFIALGQKLQYFPETFYKSRNVNKQRPLIEDVDKKLIDLIKKHNLLDIELYNYAKQKFNEKYSAHNI